jgi:hypothetical protein
VKTKIIISVALSLINISAMAYEGENFRIISEKMTQSPGFNGKMISIDSNSVKKTLNVQTMACAHDAIGKPQEYITVQSDHRVNLYNATSKTTRYTYTYILSCENAYQNFERTVELYANGNFIDSSHSYGSVQKDIEGVYRINAITNVNGEENASHYSQANLKISK